MKVVDPLPRAGWLLRDMLSRIVAAREEFDPLVREQILEDIEYDLAGSISDVEQAVERDASERARIAQLVAELEALLTARGDARAADGGRTA
jgi:hypothetical protein